MPQPQVPKDSISISFVREAAEALRSRGVDPAPALAAAGIPAALLASDSSHVSARSFSKLWLVAASALDDEFFAQDSRRMKVGSFAALCHHSVHAKNLRAALARLSRLLDIVLDDLAVTFGAESGQACLRLSPTARARAAGIVPQPFAYETLLVMLHGLVCWLIGRRVPIVEARFAYPRPARWPEYRLMFSQNLAFEQPVTEIRFDAAYLDAPVKQDERSAKEFLREAPYNIVLKYKDTKSWSARLRHELRDAAPAGWPNFDLLAQRLKIGPSALRRKLEGEGSSFRLLKDALRRDLAIDRLTHSDAPIPEIAHALGFAEPSAFHRAFKQWTGVRPGEYRRKAAQGLLSDE